MKTKNQPKHKKPIHLHIEHISRAKSLLIIFVGLMMIAIAKTDSKLLGMMREAYAQGYGQVGSYMREETVRSPLTIALPRIPTISGK